MEDRDPQEGVPKISRDDTAIDLLDIHLISLVEKTCIRLGGAPPRRDSNSDLSQVRGTLSASVEQEVDETQTLSSLSREGRIPPWYTLGMDAGMPEDVESTRQLHPFSSRRDSSSTFSPPPSDEHAVTWMLPSRSTDQPHGTRARDPPGFMVDDTRRKIRTTPTAESHQSLGTWLLPSPGTVLREPRRTAHAHDLRAESMRMWSSSRCVPESSALSDEAANSRGTLSQWLEPRTYTGVRKRLGRSHKRTDTASSHTRPRPSDEEDSQGHPKWMSERLVGLDPDGAARAKDCWTRREKKHQTVTDVALGAKRKAAGGRGWRTTAGGDKVYVTPARPGKVAISREKSAYQKSLRGRKKRVG